MTELRHRLERLAGRGAPGRGADDVVAAALRAADGDTFATDGITSGERAVHDDLEPIELELADAPRARHARRRPMRALAAAGLAALVGVGVLAISALSGGGADSAEDAVRQLANAIDAEDPLAAADVLAPSEVRTLRATLDQASRRAAELRLVETASSPLAGIDLSVEGLELDGEELADGYTRVYLRGGIRASTNTLEFSELVQRAIDEPSTSSDTVDLRDLSPAGLDPFVVAVREDGRWYVSAAYTVLEYIREANDAGPADYGSAIAQTGELGAESPEEAARAMADALVARDWTRVFSLLPPDEIPVYDYRAAFAELLTDTETDFTVEQWDASATVDGDAAVLTVRAGGSFGDGERWNLADECLYTTFTYGAYVDEEFPEYDVESSTETTSICFPDRGGYPFSYFFGNEGPGSGTVSARAVQHDGRWFLSPVGTALDHLDLWVQHFDERTLSSILDVPETLEPDGTVALGTPITGDSAGTGLAYTFTFDGVAGQRIVGALETDNGRNPRYSSYGDVRIIHADGRTFDQSWALDGYPVTLPETGEYLLVVRTFTSGPFTLTVWDEADAPAGVIDEFGVDEGYFDENGNYCYMESPDGEVCELGAPSPIDGTTATSIAVSVE